MTPPVFESGPAPSAMDLGDRIEILERDGMLDIEVENPWAGDSVAGFGRTGRIRLSNDDGRRLRDWLCTRLGPPE